MTKNELLTLAIKLDAESGFPELTAEESWKAETILGMRRHALHLAAMYVYFASSQMEEEHGRDFDDLVMERTGNRL